MDSIRSRCGDWMKYKAVRFLLLCLVSGALVAALSGAAIAKYAVIIEDEGARTVVYTSLSEPAKILQTADVALGVHDTLTFSGFTGGEGTIRVNRASLVTIRADGAERAVYIAEGTVADALKKAGVTVRGEDLIDASPAEPVNADMTVTVNRVDTKTVERVEKIPHEVVEIPTQTLKAGKTRAINEGADGEKVATVRLTLIDGKPAGEETLSEKVTAEPVTAQILVGDNSAPTSQLTPDTPVELDANGNPVRYLTKVTGKATAYSALGKPTKLVPGCVAMDLSKYPRGSRLYIKTPDGSYIYGYSEVRDTGPAVNEGIILVDLFFGSYRESCLFGAKTVDIYVLP